MFDQAVLAPRSYLQPLVIRLLDQHDVQSIIALKSSKGMLMWYNFQLSCLIELQAMNLSSDASLPEKPIINLPAIDNYKDHQCQLVPADIIYPKAAAASTKCPSTPASPAGTVFYIRSCSLL